MNSWNHAQSAARKWGGEPEHYIELEELVLDMYREVTS